MSNMDQQPSFRRLPRFRAPAGALATPSSTFNCGRQDQPDDENEGRETPVNERADDVGETPLTPVNGRVAADTVTANSEDSICGHPHSNRGIKVSLGFSMEGKWGEMTGGRPLPSLVSLEWKGPVQRRPSTMTYPVHAPSGHNVTSHQNVSGAILINGIKLNGVDGLPAGAGRSVRTLIFFMESSLNRVEMQAQSLIALGNAIRESIEKQQALLNVGGLRTIAFAMKTHRHHSIVQECGVWVLCLLSQDKRMAAQVARGNGVKMVCEMLEAWNHTNVPIPIQEQCTLFLWYQLSSGNPMATKLLCDKKTKLMTMLLSLRDGCTPSECLENFTRDDSGVGGEHDPCSSSRSRAPLLLQTLQQVLMMLELAK